MCRISRWCCRASHAPRPETTPAWLSIRRAKASVIRSHCAYAVSKWLRQSLKWGKRQSSWCRGQQEKDRNLALTTVCVIYNLILELEWLLMHLPKGLPAAPTPSAAAASALASIQYSRPKAKWAKAPSSAIPLATVSAPSAFQLPLTHSLNVSTLMTKIMAQ